ncbi:hypothetical protein VMT65_25560 [Nocardia sp. CDC153]|uniref:hypothetical protein n=1 Tax=Nocardia sp. CDC153 TaxID=3112167 RepID=UPI002DB92D0B|nr:hypothetical protein [Nocardia sp. CDC153]MEC3956426.1 hypothetical protein [Nocardia sp. CDC153]
MYDYHLDWKYAAAPDKHPRPQTSGYLIGLIADTTTLSPDVSTPATFTGVPNYPGIGKALNPATKTMHTCGLIENLDWDGEATAPLHMGFYVSERNQQSLQNAVQRGNLLTITDLKFWVVGYEFPAQSGKPGTWYEVAYPIGAASEPSGSVHGRINRTGANLDIRISDVATPVDPTGQKMFACEMSVVPAVNVTFTLFQATSPTNKQVYTWGVGK